MFNGFVLVFEKGFSSIGDRPFTSSKKVLLAYLILLVIFYKDALLNRLDGFSSGSNSPCSCANFSQALLYLIDESLLLSSCNILVKILLKAVWNYLLSKYLFSLPLNRSSELSVCKLDYEIILTDLVLIGDFISIDPLTESILSILLYSYPILVENNRIKP